jgi:hypothetical protein
MYLGAGARDAAASQASHLLSDLSLVVSESGDGGPWMGCLVDGLVVMVVSFRRRCTSPSLSGDEIS